MIIPEQIAGESLKAHAAFVAYVEQGDNRSMRKVAQQLHKSRQLLTRWASKHRWQERLAALKQAECEQRIKAEQQAVEATALITEAGRAEAANRVFTVAHKLIESAEHFAQRAADTTLSLAERQLASSTASRFFSCAKDIGIGEVGGAAADYSVPQGLTIQVSQAIGAPIQSIAEAEAIIAEAEEAQARECRPLPCDNWSPDSPDATPIEVKPDDPPQAKPNDGKQDFSVPSRVDMLDRLTEPPEGTKRCMVPVHGL